jgi:hypothetical protein
MFRYCADKDVLSLNRLRCSAGFMEFEIPIYSKTSQDMPRWLPICELSKISHYAKKQVWSASCMIYTLYVASLVFTLESSIYCPSREKKAGAIVMATVTISVQIYRP